MEELSFEQRLKKAKVGYKRKRTEQAPREVIKQKEKELSKVNKGRKKVGMPKERYSKIPVGHAPMMVKTEQKEKFRDPRFDPDGDFNKGLFEASYKFVEEIAKDRERDIKGKLKYYKRKIQKKQKLTEDELKEQQRLIDILNEEGNCELNDTK